MAFRSHRLVEPELLDLAPDEIAAPNLADLSRIHRWLGGRWVLQRVLAPLAAREEPLRILDVGAASGDTARDLGDLYPRAEVVSMDLRARNMRQAPDPRVVANAFAPPFGTRTFDVVIASLFLHHFDGDEAIGLLRLLDGLARRALVIVDLERSRLAYHFLPATRPLFRWSPLTVHDGQLSVQAGFRGRELAGLAARAGLRAVKVRRHFPWFRVSLVSMAAG